eukprot:gene9111-10684_t
MIGPIFKQTRTHGEMISIGQVLETLYGDRVDTALQNDANRWLLELQQHAQIVPVCLELLQNDRLHAQFFGMQTLYTRIHADWESRWTDDLRLTVKNAVFARFLNDQGGDPVLLSKIAYCIAAVSMLWETPVTDLLNLFRSASSSDLIKKGVLDILGLLPQEHETVVLSQSRREKIKEAFRADAEPVMVMFSSTLETMDNVEIVEEVLSLIGDLINFHTYRAPLSNQQPATAKNIHSSDSVNFEQFITPIIRKLVALKAVYTRAVTNNDALRCRAFAEVLTQIVECYTPALTDIDNADILNLLAFILDICSHHDKEMSEITFDGWIYLSEHVSQVENEAHKERFQQIYAQLLQILIQKASYPSNITKVVANSELAEDISSYRSNVCDLIVSCYETIQENAFLPYLDNLLRNECKTWQSCEVVVYVFRCIYEEVMNDDPHADRIIAFTLTLPAHPTLSNTILKMIEDYGDYIYEQEDLLKSSFIYILSLAQHEEIRTTARM